MAPQRDETGAATMFVVLMTIALLAAAGLVIDGGYALAERRQLTTQAQQAARVGADALEQNSLRDGGAVAVDPSRARAAASAYLQSVGAPAADINVTGGQVTVTLRGNADTAILSVVGVTSIPVAGTGAAESIDANTP